MTASRSRFGLVSQDEIIYAIGGRWDWENRHNSVESFHSPSNLTLEDDMTLNHTRLGHCSLGFNNSLFVVAGFVNGNGSKSLMKFDLGPDFPRELVSLADLEVPRYYPAYSVVQLQGQDGVFVSGGERMNDVDGITIQNSVELKF